MSAPDYPFTQQVEHLYCNHHSWLQGWLRKKLGNPFDAADIAQDTFIRVLAGRQKVRVQEPRAYLTTIAKGLVIDRYQRQALEQAYLATLVLLPVVQHPSAEERYLILETLHEIDAMLDALPAQVRQVFLLSQIEGLKYEEIAEQMGIALITVKRYMKQAFLQCLTCIAAA